MTTESDLPSTSGTVQRRPMARIVRWRQPAPGRLQFLDERVSRERISWRGYVVHGIDGAALLEVGACATTEMQGGAFLVAPDAEGLLATGRCEELLACLDRSEDGGSGRLLRAVCAGAGVDLVRDEIVAARGSDAGILPALVLALSLGDDRAAHDFLRAALARQMDERDRLNAARTYLLALGAETDARALIESLESGIGIAQQLAAAQGWSELFGDRPSARRCLESAERQAATWLDWRKCAAAWLEALDETDDARRCQAKAEAMANAWPSLLHCAEAWKRLFDDVDAAGRCLRAMDAASSDLMGLERRIAAHADLRGPDEARRHLWTAETQATDSPSWTLCAGVWSRVLGQPDEGRRCMVNAERSAADVLDAIWCARAWREALGDVDGTRKSLQSAERKATTAAAWNECARAWQELMNDPIEAGRCRELARRMSAGEP